MRKFCLCQQKLLTYTISVYIVHINNFWCIVSQHFLLTAAARTLSLASALRMSDEEAHARFVAIRWSDNDGRPYCPHCGGTEIYAFRCRPIWRCKGCHRQFSVTSGTMFHSRKLPHRDYLAAIAIFVNAVKGVSALQLGRDLDVQYKTAFVLAHKLREAMGSQIHNPDEPELEGTVDGAYFGGHTKPENRKEDRRDRRLAEEQTGKRQVVVVLREILGRTLPFIVPCESAAVPLIRKHVASGTIITPTNRAHGSGSTRLTTRGESITARNTRQTTV
jgi:transposase-like protein